MSTKISNCAIAIGHLEGVDFGPAGQKGDWAVFQGVFTTGPKPIFTEVPRLIVTSISYEFDFGAFPVCVIRDLSTTGFTLAARNMAAHGFTAFNWMAVRETPGIKQLVPDVSIGVLPPLFFGPVGAPNSEAGTTTISEVSTDSGAVLLTATDQNVSGHSVAAVGALRSVFVERIGKSSALVARNPDIVSGDCAFNWASFTFNAVFDPDAFTLRTTVDDKGSPMEIETPVPEIQIETGEVSPARFQPSGQPGDWHTWEVNFSDSFSTTPVVLLTPNKAKTTLPEANPAVVGVVQAVSPHGFRLAARNSDLGSGETGFYWVALSLPLAPRP